MGSFGGVPAGAGPSRSWPTCDGQPATIVGGMGNDNLRGTKGNDVIVGLGGDDVIDGLGGDGVVCGGAGDDALFGHRGNDVLIGGAGDDGRFGESGNDIEIVGPGDDQLSGAGLDGGRGSDRAAGDDGQNLCLDTEASSACSADGWSQPTDPTVDTTTCQGKQATMVGTTGSDVIVGTSGNDVIVGLGGNDVIDG